ncbi:unnamed protein product [Rotaria sp. Silwood2]|nr:unnamed protein product [Rotaria sp. Silwood2]
MLRNPTLSENTKWRQNSVTVSGGNGRGNRSDHLYCPAGAIIDNEKDSLIICDYVNDRAVRWSPQNGESGETIISNIRCWGLTMDDERNLYIVDFRAHDVRRYRMGENQGTVVAGGNGQGNRLDQLNNPRHIFVDRDQSVYVSDCSNHRVMKWMKGAKQGIVAAGVQDRGNRLGQLSNPRELFVDQSGSAYLVDQYNHRIMRWSQGAQQRSIIIGGNGQGSQSNQLYSPIDLTFDREGNIYVFDNENHRVQKFNIDRH